MFTNPRLSLLDVLPTLAQVGRRDRSKILGADGSTHAYQTIPRRLPQCPSQGHFLACTGRLAELKGFVSEESWKLVPLQATLDTGYASSTPT